MVGVHHAVAFAVLAATFGAAAAGAWTYYRRREPRGLLTHLLALAQTVLIAQVALGLRRRHPSAIEVRGAGA